MIAAATLDSATHRAIAAMHTTATRPSRDDTMYGADQEPTSDCETRSAGESGTAGFAERLTGYSTAVIDEAVIEAPPPARMPEGLDVGLLAVMRSFVRSSMSVGRDPGRSFERLAQAVCSRVVQRSLEDPRPIRDLRELQAALSQRSSIPFDGTGAVIITKAVLSRVGPLKVLAGRTPWLMAASAVPDMYSALARGREEVAIVSSFLVNRAGGAGADIDPERLRRVTVQLLQRRRVDPETDSDADLVSSWIRRALKSALPFVKGGVTPHPKRIAAAAATVDPSMLRGSPATRDPDYARTPA